MERLPPSRLLRRMRLAYHLICAREDARRRHLTAPVGVWLCDHCENVFLTSWNFTWHQSSAHA